MRDLSQIAEISPDQLAMDDDQFYLRLASQDLMVPEYHEGVLVLTRAYILWDVSPSMYDSERGGAVTYPNGETGLRDTFARAILAKLLVKAEKESSEYFLRPFSEDVHLLQEARNRKEAAELLNWVVSEGIKGAGTNIGRALNCAVSDVRAEQEIKKRTNHILLISDGDDQAGLTRETVHTMLGDDIKLHVMLIGIKYGPEHPLAEYVIAQY
jgi:uncharacterized protein with von Willebrand factor type A (vWA) domain